MKKKMPSKKDRKRSKSARDFFCRDIFQKVALLDPVWNFLTEHEVTPAFKAAST